MEKTTPPQCSFSGCSPQATPYGQVAGGRFPCLLHALSFVLSVSFASAVANRQGHVFCDAVVVDAPICRLCLCWPAQWWQRIP
jgi:hypothetical protein